MAANCKSTGLRWPLSAGHDIYGVIVHNPYGYKPIKVLLTPQGLDHHDKGHQQQEGMKGNKIVSGTCEIETDCAEGMGIMAVAIVEIKSCTVSMCC